MRPARDAGRLEQAVLRKLLVANRGEIAVRILRACRELGIRSVAIYSDADRTAAHVRYADEAYCVGPAPAAESYLNIERIVSLAKESGAEAVHPGYGFLSENARFAEACSQAGITFVGPPASAIRMLGDKIEARRRAGQAGVPVVPGSAEIRDVDEAERIGTQIGYPVVIKAAGGGGGRGIREVDTPSAFRRAFETARQEALTAFGNDALYVEKLIRPVRHIEVQIIADRFGNVVALGERECSIQRRHQKIIEECPSPFVDPLLRHRLFDAAVRAALSANYVNIGTVEFLVDADRNFYFLEMNTRLQVEHPVTELVAGVDLVADQIRVAAGEALPYSQHVVNLRGWAIECRIVAEDPASNLPSVGRVEFAREPAGPGVRVESALHDGMEVSVYYDPLVAKVTAWGRDRMEAIRRMRRALSEFKIVGVRTNIPFHMRVMEDPFFRAGQVDTSFIDRDFQAEYQAPEVDRLAALITAAVLLRHSAGPVAVEGGAAPAAGSRWRKARLVAPATPQARIWAWHNGTS